jgi:hypothetical protein
MTFIAFFNKGTASTVPQKNITKSQDHNMLLTSASSSWTQGVATAQCVTQASGSLNLAQKLMTQNVLQSMSTAHVHLDFMQEATHP